MNQIKLITAVVLMLIGTFFCLTTFIGPGVYSFVITVASVSLLGAIGLSGFVFFKSQKGTKIFSGIVLLLCLIQLPDLLFRRLAYLFSEPHLTEYEYLQIEADSAKRTNNSLKEISVLTEILDKQKSGYFSRRRELEIISQLADSYEKTKNYDQAEELLKKQIELIAKSKTYWSPAGSLNQLGDIEYKRQSYARAADYYKQALDIYDKQNDIPWSGTIQCLESYSKTLYKLGRKSEAKQISQKAQQMRDSLK